MSHDAMAGYVYELNQDLIVQHAKEELDTLMATLEEVDFEPWHLAKWCDTTEWNHATWDQWDDDDDAKIDAIEAAFKAVQEKMLAETGLEVTMTDIDPDDGSEYNEVEGSVWCVINAVQLTPPAEKFKDYIDHKFFCIFG
jgi:hypothetical protein